MNDNAVSTPAITISAAGVRLRDLAPHIRQLETATVAPGVSDATRATARRSLAILNIEDEALRDYITAAVAITPEDALVQIDAIALAVEAMASEDDLADDYKRLAGQIFRVLASAAGVLSNVAGHGLDEFTATGLDQTFAVAFPLAARSAFAAAHLN